MIDLIIGVAAIIKKTIINTQVIGLVKKIFKLPPEIIKAFLILDSKSGAKTKDKSIGAVG